MRTGILLTCLCITSSALAACTCSGDTRELLRQCERRRTAAEDALKSRTVGDDGRPGPAPAAPDAPATAEAPAPTLDDTLAPVEEPEATVTELKPGTTYRFTSGNQTVVLNPKPVDDGVWRFRKGDTCRFDPGATVRVVGKHVFKEDEDEWYEYLVRYEREPIPDDLPERIAPRAPLEEDSPPYQCPDGTVFFLDDETVVEEVVPEPDADELEKIEREEREWMEKLYETVRQMLQDEPLPGTIKVHR